MYWYSRRLQNDGRRTKHPRLTAKDCRGVKSCTNTNRPGKQPTPLSTQHPSTHYFTTTIIEQMSLTHYLSNDAFSGISALDHYFDDAFKFSPTSIAPEFRTQTPSSQGESPSSNTPLIETTSPRLYTRWTL